VSARTLQQGRSCERGVVFLQGGHAALASGRERRRGRRRRSWMKTY
jgi:hypothetical protein